MTCYDDAYLQQIHTRRERLGVAECDQLDKHFQDVVHVADPCINITDPTTLAGIRAGVTAAALLYHPSEEAGKRTQQLVVGSFGPHEQPATTDDVTLDVEFTLMSAATAAFCAAVWYGLWRVIARP